MELDLCNCTSKTNLKGGTGIDTTELTSITDLTSLKTKVDDLDIDELKTVAEYLSKLSNVVDNDVVKKLCTIR